MITIKNYDSSCELSNYKIGDVYTFYIHNPNMKRLVNVKETEFEPYIEKLINIIDTHEGGEAITFNGYDVNTPNDTELLVPAPYDDIYVRWLEAQIDYSNADYGRYSNSMTMYNAAYSAYERYYNRNNMPLGKSFKYF